MTSLLLKLGRFCVSPAVSLGMGGIMFGITLGLCIQMVLDFVPPELRRPTTAGDAVDALLFVAAMSFFALWLTSEHPCLPWHGGDDEEDEDDQAQPAISFQRVR